MFDQVEVSIHSPNQFQSQACFSPLKNYISHTVKLQISVILFRYFHCWEKYIHSSLRQETFLTITERPRIKWDVLQKRRHGFASACVSLFYKSLFSATSGQCLQIGHTMDFLISDIDSQNVKCAHLFLHPAFFLEMFLGEFSKNVDLKDINYDYL